MRSAFLILTLPFALAACGGDASDNAMSLEVELAQGEAANGVDPEVMAALNDPIMVDPQLSAKSNADAIRPSAQPYSAALPHPSIAAGSPLSDADSSKPAPAATATSVPAARQAITLAALAGGRCGPRLSYSATWATRLPAALSLHPDARVIEAGGVKDQRCALVAVTFHITRPMEQLIDWQHARTTEAGYSIEHLADGALHILQGRKANGASYTLYVTDSGDGGADADLIVEGR